MEIFRIGELCNIIYSFLSDVDIIHCASTCHELESFLCDHTLRNTYHIDALLLHHVTIGHVFISNPSTEAIHTINSYKSPLNVHCKSMVECCPITIDGRHFVILTLVWRASYESIINSISYDDGTILFRANVIVTEGVVTINNKSKIPDDYKTNIIRANKYECAFIVMNKHKKYIICSMHAFAYKETHIYNVHMTLFKLPFEFKPCSLARYSISIYFDEQIYENIESLICRGFSKYVYNMSIVLIRILSPKKVLDASMFVNMTRLIIRDSLVYPYDYDISTTHHMIIGSGLLHVVNNSLRMIVHVETIPYDFTTTYNDTLYELVLKYGKLYSPVCDTVYDLKNTVRFHNNVLTMSMVKYDIKMADFMNFCLTYCIELYGLI